jgi:acyl-CoA reductase-like NAD-dependent aldehyde dehydrogenase
LQDALVGNSATVVVSDSANADTQLGPINNRAQQERLLSLIADAKHNVFSFAIDGGSPDGPSIPPWSRLSLIRPNMHVLPKKNSLAQFCKCSAITASTT